MRPRLVILGAGGHGAVVADCAAESGAFSQVAFLDDRWPGLLDRDGWPVVGRLTSLGSYAQPADLVFVGLGDTHHRQRLVAEIRGLGLKMATLVHPRSIVSRRAELDAGCLVAAGAVLNVGARVAECGIVNTGATVDHHCELAALVHVCPGAHLGGAVTVGARSWLGIGCSVKHGISIGEDVTVGAGAAVIADVPHGATVLGVPARGRGDSGQE